VDFYGITAQVIPVLLLALMFDSKYLERVHKRERPGEIKFWQESRVRAWGLFMVSAALVGESVVVLVLVDWFPEGLVAKVLGVLGLAALIGSMFVRLFTVIIDATRVT
jgi:hypothetical protein